MKRLKSISSWFGKKRGRDDIPARSNPQGDNPGRRLWVDEPNALEILDQRSRRGQIAPEWVSHLNDFVSKGYTVFENAVDCDLIDEYVKYFDGMWDNPPANLHCLDGGREVAITPDKKDIKCASSR